MNKQKEKYLKKANSLLKTIIWIAVLVFLLGILISIVNFTINNRKSNEKELLSSDEIGFTTSIENDKVYYDSTIEINIDINNYKIDSLYSIDIFVNEEKNVEKTDCNEQSVLTIAINNEGEKDIKIILYENGIEKYQENAKIYIVRPYRKQFLDELSNNGVSAHFSMNMDNSKTLELLENLGIRYIRDDIAWKDIEDQNGNMNFSKYDDWINKIQESRHKFGGNFK